MSTGPGPTPAETIGQRLKRLRLEQGLSQRELASPGVSYAYISRIEAGTRQPSVKALRRLGAKLGVSAEYLETGSVLDPAERRELRLADLELAIRLGESDGVEERLQELVDEAVAAGDSACALRGRVALASVALESGAFGDTVDPARGRPRRRAVRSRSTASRSTPTSAAPTPAPAAPTRRSTCSSAVSPRSRRRAATPPSPSGTRRCSATRSATAATSRARSGSCRTRSSAREESEDPYMRVRLYWSMARLAHQEGRASVALTNVRKAIALLQATDDSFHLARAHILAAGITLTRDDVAGCERHLDHAEQLLGPHPVDAGRGRDQGAALAGRRPSRGRRRSGRAGPARRSSSSGTSRRRTRDWPSRRSATGSRSPASIPAPTRRTAARPICSRRRAGGATRPRRAARGRRCSAPPGTRNRRSTCSTARPSSVCGRRRRTPDQSVELRALSFELPVTPRGPYSLALSRTPLERRDADLPRRRADGTARR